jgi:hypothetical protein
MMNSLHCESMWWLIFTSCTCLLQMGHSTMVTLVIRCVSNAKQLDMELFVNPILGGQEIQPVHLKLVERGAGGHMTRFFGSGLRISLAGISAGARGDNLALG